MKPSFLRRLNSYTKRRFPVRTVYKGKFPASLTLRGLKLNKYKKILETYQEPIGSSTTNDCYFNRHIQDKTVLLLGLGKNVRGSMQYILNELNTSDEFKGFKVFVRTGSDTDEIVKNYIAENHWARTTTVLKDSDYRNCMESCKYLITEVYFPEVYVKKPEQIYINIWHGTPLKSLGLTKNSTNHHNSGVTQKNFIDADYLLYPNEYTREKMLQSYKVSNLMNGKVFLCGYPRTGGLLDAAKNPSGSLKKRLAPNGEKLYAYMPTFRDYVSPQEGAIAPKELLDYLDEQLCDDQILYVNLHHKVSGSIDYSGYKHIRQFPADVDSYKLLALTDALISDYSSVFFDYLASRKHIILYMYDYEEYYEKRGMYMDIMDLPFDKAKTKEEVLTALNTGKTYDDTEVFETFCKYDSTDNAKKLCRLLLGKEQGLPLSSIPKDSKKNILLYADALQDDAATDSLRTYSEKYNHNTKQLIISCDTAKVNQNKDSAYPMLFHNPVIGITADPHMSGMGVALKKLYLRNQISFKTAYGYLRYEYLLMGLRMFSRASFDSVVIYDVDNPEMLLTLTELKAPKILFARKKVLEQANSDPFLRDALRYAAKKARYICVSSPDRELAKNTLKCSSFKLKVIDSISALDPLLDNKL